MDKSQRKLLSMICHSHLFPKISKNGDKLSVLEAYLYILYNASVSPYGHYSLTSDELAHICSIEACDAVEYLMLFDVDDSFEKLGFEIHIGRDHREKFVFFNIDVNISGDWDE